MTRPAAEAERALLVHAVASAQGSRAEEFCGLASAAGALTVGEIQVTAAPPSPKTFITSGKLDQLRMLKLQSAAELLLVDMSLSPSQERNLARELGMRVLDRTGLILDIFAQRARSFEGQLQVELAQLTRLSTRLVRGWTHLERQRGGIGLRGPGEKQLETDRRLIGSRIRRLRAKLATLKAQRQLSGSARQRAGLPLIALIGYTNAGKSSLFNALTEAQSYTADQVFATLDTTHRRLSLDGNCTVVLVDTVGFVRDLPHELVEAFQATLGEIVDADLLLHVVDSVAPDREEQIANVEQVCRQIGAQHVPELRVYSKIDLLDDDSVARLGGKGGARVSSVNHQGVDALRKLLRERLFGKSMQGWMQLPPTAGKLRAKLYDARCVINEKLVADGSIHIRVALNRNFWKTLEPQERACFRLN